MCVYCFRVVCSLPLIWCLHRYSGHCLCCYSLKQCLTRSCSLILPNWGDVGGIAMVVNSGCRLCSGPDSSHPSQVGHCFLSHRWEETGIAQKVCPMTACKQQNWHELNSITESYMEWLNYTKLELLWYTELPNLPDSFHSPQPKTEYHSLSSSSFKKNVVRFFIDLFYFLLLL